MLARLLCASLEACLTLLAFADPCAVQELR